MRLRDLQVSVISIICRPTTDCILQGCRPLWWCLQRRLQYAKSDSLPVAHASTPASKNPSTHDGEEDFLPSSLPSSSERSSRSSHSAKLSSGSSLTARSSIMSSASSGVSSYSALSPTHCQNASPPTASLPSAFEPLSDDELFAWTPSHSRLGDKKQEGEGKKLQKEAQSSGVSGSHKSEGKKRRREDASSTTSSPTRPVIDLTSDGEVIDLTSDAEPDPKRRKVEPEASPPVVARPPNLVLVHFHKVNMRDYIIWYHTHNVSPVVLLFAS